MGHYVYVRNKKTKPQEPGWWPEKKKVEAVTTYLSTGNLSLTAGMINVPIDTIRKWKAQVWWKECVEKVYEEDNLQLSSKLQKTLEKSLDAVNDRIENGEYMFNIKTGKLNRIPAKLRDLHKVSADLIDRQAILKKQRPVEQPTAESTDGRLLKLAEAFAELALKQKPREEKVVNEVYEGDFHSLPENYQEAIDAVHVKRNKESLQEMQTEQVIDRVQQENS